MLTTARTDGRIEGTWDNSYQNFLRVTYSPSQFSYISICEHNGWRKLDAEHFSNSIHNSLGILAVPLDVAAEWFAHCTGSNVRVAVEAVLYHR